METVFFVAVALAFLRRMLRLDVAIGRALPEVTEHELGEPPALRPSARSCEPRSRWEKWLPMPTAPSTMLA